MTPRTSSIFILLRTLTLIHTPVVVPDTSFLPFDEEESLIYRYRQQQSVNLGSWFVHENWMTPSLFSQASGKKLSELDIASGWGSLASARNVLEYHWLTFINQSDFDYLASIGINTVRLPIGYWSLGSEFCLGTPFANVAEVYQNAWPMVVHAINMAAKAGIGVLVDLHGAVGSQNGEGHSGISDGAVNLFSNEDYINKTIGVLEFLARNLVFVTNVVGIQLLNEPKDIPELTDFYDRAIAVMRQVSPAAAALPLYLHDGFNLQRFSDYVAQRTDFVVQDHHKYFVFTDADKAKAASQLTSEVNTVTYTRLHDASLHQHRNLIVGEWSCALTPTSLTNEPDKVGARRDFCTSQMKIYSSTTAGWSFWGM
ncbi:glycoside hydrolase family 5 protein [Amanita thiersii Skay4041]|uniref:Glycoside hydrolase family 5 protein n=1 Tax=Amanita thiersii Skay4041 TaxID=703135 RepID=A0A2A9NX59_9AGAR|nr:glycoside hydrolase family 5 protein [Amanita thiersii Skay4041]